MSHRSMLWILVADGARARVLTPEAVEGRFRTLLPLGTAEHPHAPPAIRDTSHALRRIVFAEEVAERLNSEALAGRFDRLVLVGPGHVLHDLQLHLKKSAAEAVIGTVVGDFTRLNDHDLSPHLAVWWHAPAELV